MPIGKTYTLSEKLCIEILNVLKDMDGSIYTENEVLKTIDNLNSEINKQVERKNDIHNQS